MSRLEKIGKTDVKQNKLDSDNFFLMWNLAYKYTHKYIYTPMYKTTHDMNVGGDVLVSLLLL